jgi:hypothetical protein
MRFCVAKRITISTIALRFPSPTSIGAIFYFVPAAFPFFPPGKWQVAYNASFGWEIGFFALFCHGVNFWIVCGGVG